MSSRLELGKYEEYGCAYPSNGDYTQTTTLPRPKHMYPTEHYDWINVDKCMVNEILDLWRSGIWTLECCCGHGRAEGYVAVHGEHREKIEALWYEPSAEAPHVYKKKSQCQTDPAPMGDEVREAVEHISKKLELDRSYVGSFSDSDDSHVSRIVRSKMKTIKIYETLITAAEDAGRLRDKNISLTADLLDETTQNRHLLEEIAALRLELAKSKEQGLIEGLRRHIKAIPLGAENVGNGASEYNWGVHYLDVLKNLPPPPAIPSEPSCGGG